MLSTTASMTSRAGRRGGVPAGSVRAADIPIMTGRGISEFRSSSAAAGRRSAVAAGCGAGSSDAAGRRAQLSFNRDVDVLRKSERNY